MIHTMYVTVSPDTAKYKITVPNDSEEIEWVRQTAKHGFMTLSGWDDTTTICLFHEADHMMYILRWH